MISKNAMYIGSFAYNYAMPGHAIDQWEDNLEYDRTNTSKIKWYMNKHKKSYHNDGLLISFISIEGGNDIFNARMNIGLFEHGKGLPLANTFPRTKRDIIVNNNYMNLENELSEYVFEDEEGMEYEFEYEYE